MMTMTACPTQEKLKAFALGQLPELQSDDLFEHLRTCELCRAQLETVENSEDSLIASLRSPDSLSGFDAEPGCRDAVAKALGALSSTPRAAPGNHDSTSDVPLPRTIGEYELVRPLGRGGMGHVFLARHSKLGREVALKLLASHRLANLRMRERFENEMRAVGRLSHPNIVTAYDAREIEGTAVLVTEFIDGMDLSQLTNRLGRIPIPEACEIIRQVAVALEYTHQQGFVHRDVKPSNIMLSRQGDVKLLDLGLARWQMEDSQQAELTGTGQAMGTADYVAPEQVTDSRHVDIRADIYALGCTLFKLLTGSAPFADDRHVTAFAKMTAHVSSPPPILADVIPTADPQLSTLIENMLAKDPEQRPSPPMSIAEQLAKFSHASNLQALIQRAESEGPAEPASRINSPIPKPKSLMQQSVPVWLATMGALAGLILGLCLGILIKIQYPDGTELSLEVPAGSTITQEFISEADPNKPSKTPQENMNEQLPGLAEDAASEATLPDAMLSLSPESLQPFSFAILQQEVSSDTLDLDAQRLRQLSDPNLPLETNSGTWFPLRTTLENLPESSFITQVDEHRYLLLKKDGLSVVPWSLLANNIGINFRGSTKFGDGTRMHTIMEMHFQGPLQRVMREVSTRNLNGYLAIIVNHRVIHVSRIVSPIDRQAVISGQYADEDLQFLRQALDGGLVDLPELPPATGGASRKMPSNLPGLAAVKIQVTASWPNTVRAGDGTSFHSKDLATETQRIIAYVQKKLDEGAKHFVLEIDPNARYAVVNRVQQAVNQAIGDRPVNISLVHAASSDPFANPNNAHPDDPFGGGGVGGGNPFGRDPFGGNASGGSDPFGGGGELPGTDPFGGPENADPFGGRRANNPFGGPDGGDPFAGPAVKDSVSNSSKDPSADTADSSAAPAATLPDAEATDAKEVFTVIPLKSLDTQLAIAAVKKFMGDENLIIDGDIEKRQLLVKTTQERLSKIITFLETLDKAQSQPPTLGSQNSHFKGVWITRDLAGKARYRTSIYLIEGDRVLSAEIQPDGGLAKVRFGDFQWDTQDKMIQLPGLVGKAKFLNDDLLQIAGTSSDPESSLVFRISRELPQAFEDFVELCQDSRCPLDPESPTLVGFANLWMSRSTESGESSASTESRQPTPQEAFQEWIRASADKSPKAVDK